MIYASITLLSISVILLATFGCIYIRDIYSKLKGIYAKEEHLNKFIVDNARDIKSVSDVVEIINDCVDTRIGVDHHIRQKSWAVVCCHCGGEQRVKFYELPDERSTIKEMKDFLRYMNNKIVDTYPQFNKMLEL